MSNNIQNENLLYVPYPPVPYFPRNPDIPSKLNYGAYVTYGYKDEADTIESRVGKQLSSRKDSLEFVTGQGGKTNVIKLPSSPYVNYTKWDINKNEWLGYNRVSNINSSISPIQLYVDNYATNEDGDYVLTPVKDRTNYFSKEIMSFPLEATSFNDNFTYFFDGDKIVTNFDFSNPNDREKIKVGYYRLTDTIRVKAVMTSNSPGVSFFTPSIDQYTLVVGKQRIAE